ncbi:MAG: NADH-quinone oxidoreductase subunit J [Chloroflexi bacterium]|nr:NADH-quinone oxidoreductase subunit J [Chloroflexota bacterium]
MSGAGIVIAFWVLAITSVGSALAVVWVRDIFRAALFLVLCFASVAGLYITLNADFLAAVQILIYAGAISILLIFAIMLTRDTRSAGRSTYLRNPAFLIALLLFITLLFAVLNTDWQAVAQVGTEPSTTAIAQLLFDKTKGFVLPFEIASVLLLVAMIGAIALVKED